MFVDIKAAYATSAYYDMEIIIVTISFYSCAHLSGRYYDSVLVVDVMLTKMRPEVSTINVGCMMIT